jgi:hypothetical protein
MPTQHGAMRSGGIDAAGTTTTTRFGELADATAQRFARGRRLKYGTSFKYRDRRSAGYDRHEEPPKGARKYVALKADVVTYFTTKWKTEG